MHVYSRSGRILCLPIIFAIYLLYTVYICILNYDPSMKKKKLKKKLYLKSLIVLVVVNLLSF